MTRDEAIKELISCQKCGDVEMAHGSADNVLQELLKTLGYEDVVIEFEKVTRWYS